MPCWAIFSAELLVELPDTASGSDKSPDTHSTSIVYSFSRLNNWSWKRQNFNQPWLDFRVYRRQTIYLSIINLILDILYDESSRLTKSDQINDLGVSWHVSHALTSSVFCIYELYLRYKSTRLRIVNKSSKLGQPHTLSRLALPLYFIILTLATQVHICNILRAWQFIHRQRFLTATA